jgi:hypothetical protein
MLVTGSGHGSATSTGSDKPKDGVIACERRNDSFLPLYGSGDQRGFWDKAPSSSPDTGQGATAD